MSSGIDTYLTACYDRSPMKPKRTAKSQPALNIRNIPRSTFYRLKMAAAVEEQSVSELVLALIEGKVRHGGHPMLRWMADCVTVKQDENANIKPVKPERLKSSKRIDGVVALIMAMSLAIRNRQSPSIYNDPATCVV